MGARADRRTGRAGSGSSSAATSACSSASRWGNADPELVEDALTPHVALPEGHLGYRIVDEARIGPRLGDLGVEDPRDLDAALAAWHRVATREWAHEHWLAVESLQPIRGRLAVVERHLRERGRRLGLEDTWKLANAPIDPDGAEILGVLALAVAGDRDQRHLLQFLLDPARLRDASLEEAEEAGRVAAILRWFALQYPGVGGVTIERAAALEQAAAERVVRRLAVEVRDGKLGRCRSCGQSCPPWYPLCDRCARAGAGAEPGRRVRDACACTATGPRPFGTKLAHTRDEMLASVTTGHLGCPWGRLGAGAGRARRTQRNRSTAAVVIAYVAIATAFETISAAFASAMPYASHSTKPTSSTPRYGNRDVGGRAARDDAAELEQGREPHCDAERGGGDAESGCDVHETTSRRRQDGGVAAVSRGGRRARGPRRRGAAGRRSRAWRQGRRAVPPGPDGTRPELI